MKTTLATLLVVGLSGFSIAGFAADSAAITDDVRDADNETTVSSVGSASLEAENELLPIVQFEDAPLVDVIKTLARQARINLIFDPAVVAPDPSGAPLYPPVSIRLENVTAQNVLEAILNNNNLRLEKDPKTLIARITVKDPNAAEPLETRIYQLKYANPTNLMEILRPTFVTPRSQVIPDGRTSQLIVMATEDELISVDGLIEELDRATEQVLIEARMVETLKNPRTMKGIDWSGTLKAQRVSFGNNTYTPDAQVSNNMLVTQNAPSLLLDTANGFNPSTAFLDADGVHAVFSFFNEDEDSEIVATPRAVTADNVQATLSITRAIPIFRVTTGGTQAGPTVDVSYTNVGTILNVTPRISANSNIALTVIPEVSNVDGKDQQVLNGEVQTANVFAIRRMHTEVLIPSGNTLVLGGLIDDKKAKTQTKVPILGDIPGMKYIFGSTGKSRSKRNLLIFVTPTIVEPADFQPTKSDFLQRTPPVDSPDGEISPFDKPWDGVEPYDWSAPVY